MTIIITKDLYLYHYIESFIQKSCVCSEQSILMLCIWSVWSLIGLKKSFHLWWVLCLFLFIMFLASLFPLNFLFPRGHLFSNGMEQVILCELYFYSKAPIEIFTIALNDLFSDCWTNTLLEGVHNKNTCYSWNMLCHTFGDTISKKFPREEQTKRDKTS